MPIYEYSCRRCGHRLEVLQSVGAGADGLACPACGCRELRKELSTFAASGSEAAASNAGAAPSCGPGFR